MTRKARNLLVILSDEHQARALGCAGHPCVQTPCLDALAARGTRFTNAYTPSPICVPARASFATGRYPHETRLWDNAMPYTGTPRGWGHALQEAGVRVESIGKLHYRDPRDPTGFDAMHMPMMVADGIGMVWTAVRRANERIAGPKRMLGDVIGPGESSYTRYDADVTAKTIDWLTERQADERPWCLYVGLVAPHFPLIAPQDFYDLYPANVLPPDKLHPRDGYTRHPWAEAQNAFMDSEAKFDSAAERLAAKSAYFGLCTWLDHNIGQILQALEDTGLGAATNVLYSSDHGENLGARGLWGKSQLYQESTAIPMIAAGPDWPAGLCETPVSLLDLSAEIADQFGASLRCSPGIKPLHQIAEAPADPDRPVFSEYHAAGAVSGAFMLRLGQWKYHHYIDFPPELFDLSTDPEELCNRADDPTCGPILQRMETQLRAMLDPEAVNAEAFADQDTLVARFGGRDRALTLGAPRASPPPERQS